MKNIDQTPIMISEFFLALVYSCDLFLLKLKLFANRLVPAQDSHVMRFRSGSMLLALVIKPLNDE